MLWEFSTMRVYGIDFTSRPTPSVFIERARPATACTRAPANQFGIGLVGSERVRRHPHHRTCSAAWTASPAVPALIGSGSPSNY